MVFHIFNIFLFSFHVPQPGFVFCLDISSPYSNSFILFCFQRSTFSPCSLYAIPLPIILQNWQDVFTENFKLQVKGTDLIYGCWNQDRECTWLVLGQRWHWNYLLVSSEAWAQGEQALYHWAISPAYLLSLWNYMYVFIIIFLFLLFETVFLSIVWLCWNSLCRPGWPWTSSDPICILS